MQAQLITHVGHFAGIVDSRPLDLQRRRLKCTVDGTCVLGTVTQRRSRRVLRIKTLARESVERLLERAFQYLHDTMSVGMVMYWRALAWCPNEDELWVCQQIEDPRTTV